MFEPINLIKLAIVVGVPFWLLCTHHSKAMLFWICVTIGVEILNVRFIAYITPFQVVGFLCVPIVLKSLPHILKIRSGKILFWSLLLLAGVGLLYGYITPWPDLTFSRPWNQRAEGRSIVYFVRTVSHFSVAIYIMVTVVQENQNIHRLLRYLIIGTTIAAIGVIVEYFVRVDLFSVFNPDMRAWSLGAEARIRGFNGEPRVSGQVCTWGILLLIGLYQLDKRRIILLIIHIFALVLTVSTTGLIILVVGLAILTLMRPTRLIKYFFIIGLLSLCIPIFSQSAKLGLLKRWKDNVSVRLIYRDSHSPSTNLGQFIANKLEVFDASAVLFFWSNPEHLIIGTGPGLISLPASGHVPRGSAFAIYGDRIDSIPHMGFFQILSNTGMIGILLWIGIFVTSIQDLRKQKKAIAQSTKWREALIYFIIFSVLYLFQEKSIWFIFLGLGLAASINVKKRRRNYRYCGNNKELKYNIFRHPSGGVNENSLSVF